MVGAGERAGRGPPSRRAVLTGGSALAATWLAPGPAAAGDEPARLPGAVAFDLGGGGSGGGEGAPRRITLYVPPGPAPAAGWPLLTLLDGDAVIGTTVDIERAQGPHPGDGGLVSRFAVAAVGYPGGAAFDGPRRSWDYTPPPGRAYPPSTPDGPPVRTGGAAAFLRVLTEDLPPALAARCPLDPGRQALFGWSFGGLFALYALAHAPGAFTHWIAASPSVHWEDEAIGPSLAALERSPPPGGARVLLLAGAYEAGLAPFQAAAPDAEARAARLRAIGTVARARATAERLARIPGIDSRFHLIPERTHMSVLPEALNAAVAFAMGRAG